MDYYAHRLMIRANSTNHILKYRQLFHQFIVDMYAKIETERLLFIRLNQKKLRVDNYIHLHDAIANDGNVNDIGKMVILPATFTGSPRHMQEYAQDAMTYVRNYGRPDLFITFTCNSSWNEIQELLLDGQTKNDRHDVIARVFREKLAKLIGLITKSHIYGDVQCWMYSIEWQKRGLPHAHLLVWLRTKILPNQIDDIISAELPAPENDPGLFEIIKKHMVHGPCGSFNRNSPCMQDGKCSKRYPREFIRETQTGNDGYPTYKRRKPEDGGFTATVNGNDIDNRWIVPYSPLLSKAFNAHINVEYCNSVKSIKYICKYVNKGGDMAVIGLSNANALDEVSQYQIGRYISSNEAAWRIFGFSIHKRYPSVQHLSVHLENGQRIYFTEENAQQQATNPPNTTLTAYFKLCSSDPFAKTLLYAEVPKFYTWNASRKQFQRRKQGTRVADQNGIFAAEVLGRVYTVHPKNDECYFLRILLHEVRGPTSFASLKIVGEQQCETYREACEKLGLLENDQHWDTTLAEASEACHPYQIRNLFAIILTTCSPSNPKMLWEKYKENLSEDILYQLRRVNSNDELPFSAEIFNQALIKLEDKCIAINNKTLVQLGLPASERNSNDLFDRELLRERQYDTDELRAYIENQTSRLVADQKLAFDTVMNHVANNSGGLIFLDAPGGTGKTFLINLILAAIREKRDIALAIASSGIAATLLDGGRTAHSALKLPLNLSHMENATCNITRNSGMGKVLKECRIIIWDECTMAHKNALEALDRTLKDIKGNNRIFGGVLILLAGDFRQILPVIPRSTPADEINACLKSSYLWRYVSKITLSTNMRVHLLNDVAAQNFSTQLLNIGNGEFPVDHETGYIALPSDFCQVVPSLEDVIKKVFPHVSTNYKNHNWLCERAILAPKNENVNRINEQIQHQLPGPVTTYKSVDSTLEDDEAVNYPVEFLNSLEPSGMPPHQLFLKVGSPIMLLRNIDPPKLCNGTRLSVKKLMPNVIEATIITGKSKGENVFIPRIPMIPTDLPFEFKRLQFPVRLAFAMTINKAQGQSLKFCGVNLENPCFSHGQLYVACSRVGTPTNLFIYAPNGKTKNIVYLNALD